MNVELKKTKKGELARLLPWPAPDVNKYTRGKLVVVGGAEAYPGALCLAATSALRMGAGYVEAICSPEALSIVHGYNPHIVARSWIGWKAASSDLDEFDERHPMACLIGPGFDDSDKRQTDTVLSVLALSEYPVVVDGGAITVLASFEGRKRAAKRANEGLATIVTPHFGEAERMAEPIGVRMPANPYEDYEEDARFAQRLANAYHATIVLKGSCVYIASPHGQSAAASKGSARKAQETDAAAEEPAANESPEVRINLGFNKVAFKQKPDTVRLVKRGSAALAKAGTGDVLAGMIAALAAQGLSPADAADLAASLHAQAGREAARVLTEICVCAEDLIYYLPEAIRYYSGFAG